ncbi:branched-chain amino acid ABC transporter permease [Blastococcus sp. SYSU D00820]
METFLTFTVLGLVLGAVYAIAASGLVLTYNTSGVFNFAHGAQAMLGAFTYWQLTVGWGLPVWLSVVIVLGVLGPLVGAGLYTLIMKGLRGTADVTKIVVTVAVLLGFVYLSQWLWAPEEARILPLFFGVNTSVEVLGVSIRAHEIICLVLAVAIAVGLRIMFTRTRMGVTMRGVVDDPDLLQLSGHDPDRAALLSWIMGSVLAVLAGILITPIGGGALEANALTLLVIDAFAAAMFGRLRSIPRTFVGAIVLGMAGTYLVGYAPVEWTWVANVRVALPMIVLFVVLLLLPQDRLRGAATRTRERYSVPTVKRAAIWGVALVVIVWLIGLLMVPSSVTTLATGMTFAIIALSLTLLTGYAGEMNLAPLALGAIGTIIAFHVGIVGAGLGARLTWWGVLVGTLGTAVIGGLVALPALRLRGLYLALSTLAFGGIVALVVLRDIDDRGLFGGIFPNGSLIVPPVQVGPLDLGDPTTRLLTVTAVFAVLGVGVVALRRSGYGRRLAAMKDSPAASAMLGQSLVKLKLSVFMISSGIAGLGGILMSSAMGSVSGETFTIVGSLSLLMLTVVFGIGYVSGALFGGLMAGAGFVVIVGTFNGLARDSVALENVYTTLASVFVVLTALIGMGVGENPSGRAHLVVQDYRNLSKAPKVLVGGAVVEVVLYLLAFFDVIDNWWFAIGTVLLFSLLPGIGKRLAPELLLTPEERAAGARTPPELVGLEAPFTAAERDEVDRALGLPIHAPLPPLVPAVAAALPVPAPVPSPEDPAHVSA